MKVYFSTSAVLLAMQLLGCNVDVQQTDDGVTIAISCQDNSSDEEPSNEEPSVEDPTEDPSAENLAIDDLGTDDPIADEGAESPQP